MIQTKHRSTRHEIMDDFSLNGQGFRKDLDVLSLINKWLGGNHITLTGVLHLLKGQSKEKVIRIVDLGCGNGDMLRRLSVLGEKYGYHLELIGIDANSDSIVYAQELSGDFENIKFLEIDVFSNEFQDLDYDIALLTLFLHHFNDQQILEKLIQIKGKSRLGLVINDLHRHKLAYLLFNLLTLFMGSKMIRNDGLVSILKGFKRKELEQYARQIKSRSRIQWKWAFRYQWILENQK
jgi:ubiquinone/menaquinone biosynthesis C-methylase UbiE